MTGRPFRKAFASPQGEGFPPSPKETLNPLGGALRLEDVVDYRDLLPLLFFRQKETDGRLKMEEGRPARPWRD
jgi:hypothetical protein